MTAAPAFRSDPVRGRQALLFLCHRADRDCVDHFQRVRAGFEQVGDAFFALDATCGPAPAGWDDLPHFTFSIESLQSLGFGWLGPRLTPGHASFPLFQFVREHPFYRHYWLIEYDVAFTGPWRWFFRSVAASPADFVGMHFARRADQPDWMWWRTLRHPSEELPPDAMLRFFGPVYRLSRQAIDVLDRALASGWTGHFEATLPTLAAAHGLILQDLARGREFSPPRTHGWYSWRGGDRNGSLRGSSVWCRPVRRRPGLRPLTLYHPVKDMREIARPYPHLLALALARR